MTVSCYEEKKEQKKPTNFLNISQIWLACAVRISFQAHGTNFCMATWPGLREACPRLDQEPETGGRKAAHQEDLLCLPLISPLPFLS